MFSQSFQQPQGELYPRCPGALAGACACMGTGDTEGAVLHLDCAVSSVKVHIIKQQNHTGTWCQYWCHSAGIAL